MSIPLWIFNVNNWGVWSYRKQAYFISWKKLYEKVSYFSHENAKVCYICGKKILKKLSKSINYCIEAIPVIFHNGSNYDYHFIVKELANEFEGQFECLGENKEKYKTIIFPIKKETTKIDKDRKCRQYILQNKIY